MNGERRWILTDETLECRFAVGSDNAEATVSFPLGKRAIVECHQCWRECAVVVGQGNRITVSFNRTP